jgi:hypothetical protein
MTQPRRYPIIGTRIQIKEDVQHDHVWLTAGLTGVVIYVSRIIQVSLDDPIEALAAWKNTIIFFNQVNRTALRWFHQECEVIDK